MSDDEKRIRELLALVYRPEGIDIWLTGAKGSFNGERPIDLIHRGEAERVESHVRALADGTFS